MLRVAVNDIHSIAIHGVAEAKSAIIPVGEVNELLRHDVVLLHVFPVAVEIITTTTYYLVVVDFIQVVRCVRLRIVNFRIRAPQ